MAMDSMKSMSYIPVNYAGRARSPQSYCGEIANFLMINQDAWCKGASARTGDGTPVGAHDPNARHFCLLGLLERFIPNEAIRHRAGELISRAIAPHAGRTAIHTYNDVYASDVSEVISRLREAAQLSDDFSASLMRDWSITVETEADAAKNALDESLAKLVPWQSIMKQIGRVAA